MSENQKSTWLPAPPKGTFKCGLCSHCPNIKECKEFIDLNSGNTYKIKSFINCNTTFVVYRLSCPCNCFYVGRTKRRLKDRVSEHKRAIVKNNFDYPIARHFFQCHNSNPNELMVEGLEHIHRHCRGGDRLKLLLQRETWHIYNLRATVYPGLNEEIDYTPFL